MAEHMITVGKVKELLAGMDDTDLLWFTTTPGTFNISNALASPSPHAPGVTLNYHGRLDFTQERIEPPEKADDEPSRS